MRHDHSQPQAFVSPAPAAQGHTPVAPPLALAALLGAQAWQALSPAIQRRFASGHADTAYAGHLDLHCSRLGWLMAAVAGLLGGPLTTARCRQVPARVEVAADGRGGVIWSRHLCLPGRRDECLVRSTKAADAQGRLIERTVGGLAMELTLFERDGALVFRSRRYFFAWGRWQVPIPALLTPGVCEVEHRDEGLGCFRFTLEMRHPLWGRTFCQTGLFQDPEE